MHLLFIKISFREHDKNTPDVSHPHMEGRGPIPGKEQRCAISGLPSILLFWVCSETADHEKQVENFLKSENGKEWAQ